MLYKAEKLSNQNLAIRLIRVLRYNKARIERTISLLPDDNRPLFHVLPYLLHVNHKDLPGYIDNEETPFGLCNYTLRPVVAKAITEVFPDINDITEFAKKNWPKQRFIESVILMGSLGTIAQDEHSDFDYWVCIDGTSISKQALVFLQRKLTAIEKWAEYNYGLEVHFFISDIESVRKNDFGEAEGESAGSAQAVFLKAEFYTTNIVIAGRAPFWWLTPTNSSNEQYDDLYTSLKKGFSPDPDWVMDLGNIEKMDPAEIFGAAIWQLSKAMDSPFKSVLKMAKLEVFLENIDTHQPLCNELKHQVHHTNEASRKIEPVDPYALMFNQLIEHYTHDDKPQIVNLLQECLYIKSNAQLSLNVSRHSRTFKHQIMSVYVTRWGWDDAKIKHFDNIDSWSFAQHVMLSKRIHSFLIQCYRRMSTKFRTLTHTVNQQDMTVLGRRLETFYAKKSGKLDILRSGFGDEMYCSTATIRSKRTKDGRRQWSIYSGDMLTAPDKEARPFKVRTDISTTHLIMWCVINRVIDKKTKILLDYDTDPVTERDLQMLTRYASNLFKPLKVNAIPREKLLGKSYITECLAVINFESSRFKANIDEIATVYSTSWGERFIEFGKSNFFTICATIDEQSIGAKCCVVLPNYNLKKRLEENFHAVSPIPFTAIDG